MLLLVSKVWFIQSDSDKDFEQDSSPEERFLLLLFLFLYITLKVWVKPTATCPAPDLMVRSIDVLYEFREGGFMKQLGDKRQPANQLLASVWWNSALFRDPWCQRNTQDQFACNHSIAASNPQGRFCFNTPDFCVYLKKQWHVLTERHVWCSVTSFVILSGGRCVWCFHHLPHFIGSHQTKKTKN